MKLRWMWAALAALVVLMVGCGGGTGDSALPGGPGETGTLSLRLEAGSLLPPATSRGGDVGIPENLWVNLELTPQFSGEQYRNLSKNVMFDQPLTFEVAGLRTGPWAIKLSVYQVQPLDADTLALMVGETVYTIAAGVNRPILSMHRPVVLGDIDLVVGNILDPDPGVNIQEGTAFRGGINAPEMPDGMWLGVSIYRRVIGTGGVSREERDDKLSTIWHVDGQEPPLIAQRSSDGAVIHEVYIDKGRLSFAWPQSFLQDGTEAVIIRLRAGRLVRPSSGQPYLEEAQTVEEAVYPIILLEDRPSDPPAELVPDLGWLLYCVGEPQELRRTSQYRFAWCTFSDLEPRERITGFRLETRRVQGGVERGANITLVRVGDEYENPTATLVSDGQGVTAITAQPGWNGRVRVIFDLHPGGEAGETLKFTMVQTYQDALGARKESVVGERAYQIVD